MGTVTNSIGTASRDYSTLAAWAAALPANLVTNGNSYVGECYNDSEFSAGVTLSGNTTDSTHTITLTTHAGQSFRDNASVQTNALRYNQSNGVGIRTTANYATPIATSVVNCTFSNLQCKSSGANATIFIDSTGGSAVSFMNCVSEISSGLGLNANNSAPTSTNCLWYMHQSGAEFCFSGYASAIFANCTIVNTSGGGGTLHQNAGSGGSRYTNCAFFGWTTLHTGGGALTGSFNCSDVAITFGTNNQASKTFANQFVSISNTTGDFRLKTGADCLDTGLTDTADIPAANDIAGTSRPQGSAWDIGCWELVVAGTVAFNDPLWFGMTA